MALFRRKSRTSGGAVVSDRDASKADLAALKDFADTRAGVEAYIEPRTSVTQTTLLLVAADGESIRRRVASAQAAWDFARKKLDVPVYDVNQVGLPPRKREYDLRQAGKAPGGSRSSTPRSSAPTAAPAAGRRTPRETAAIMTLEAAAGVDPLPDDPSFDQLMRVYKLARKAVHPDRNGGDRTKWDKVEESARVLDLPD